MPEAVHIFYSKYCVLCLHLLITDRKTLLNTTPSGFEKRGRNVQRPLQVQISDSFQKEKYILEDYLTFFSPKQKVSIV